MRLTAADDSALATGTANARVVPTHLRRLYTEERRMPRIPPPHPKGAPKTPGSGRRKGTPNKKTIALRELMAALSGDVNYQEKLLKDFRTRRVHPSVEVRVWEYALGKPMDRVAVSANVTMDRQLDAEAERLKWLDLAELEALAAETQALMDRAFARSEAKRHGVLPAVPKEGAASSG
jgi:hypothetical protein